MSRITGWIKDWWDNPVILICGILLVYSLVVIVHMDYRNRDQGIYQVVCRNATALTYAGDFSKAHFVGDHLETNRGAYFPGPYESCEIARRGGSGERR